MGALIVAEHQIELPQWQCHKRVRAAQIVGISERGADTKLHLTGGISVPADATWMMRHEARAGGFYVVYEDGYASYSPQASFIGGYTLLTEGA